MSLSPWIRGDTSVTSTVYGRPPTPRRGTVVAMVEVTTVAPGATTKRAVPPRRTGWRLVAYWIGIACLLLAAGFGGYVAWLLWGTGLTTQRAQTTLRQGFAGVVDSKSAADAPALVPLGTRSDL